MNNCPVLGVPIKSRDESRVCTLRFVYSVVGTIRVLPNSKYAQFGGIPSPESLQTAVVALVVVVVVVI